MWKLILAVALAAVQAQPPAHPGVADPIAFMRARYAEYEGGGEVRTVALDTYASARLRARLYAFDQAAGGEELDSLDPWVDAIGWRIGPVALTPGPSRDRNRRIVVARFGNHGRPVRLRFHGLRARGAWYLDEIVKAGPDGWTLTGRLARRPTAAPNR